MILKERLRKMEQSLPEPHTRTYSYQKQREVESLFQKRFDLANSLSLGTPASRIAFSAALTGKHVHLGDGQVVEYNQVYTNVGNGFDTRHSHFIAPVKGIYLFAYSGMNANSQEVYLEMVKNDQMIAEIYLGSTDTNMGSQTTVEILERGDVVWVKHGYSPHAATLNGSGPYTFMGVLLFEV